VDDNALLRELAPFAPPGSFPVNSSLINLAMDNECIFAVDLLCQQLAPSDSAKVQGNN
jgi:hypothetical protein